MCPAPPTISTPTSHRIPAKRLRETTSRSTPLADDARRVAGADPGVVGADDDVAVDVAAEHECVRLGDDDGPLREPGDPGPPPRTVTCSSRAPRASVTAVLSRSVDHRAVGAEPAEGDARRHPYRTEVGAVAELHDRPRRDAGEERRQLDRHVDRRREQLDRRIRRCVELDVVDAPRPSIGERSRRRIWRRSSSCSQLDAALRRTLRCCGPDRLRGRAPANVPAPDRSMTFRRSPVIVYRVSSSPHTVHGRESLMTSSCAAIQRPASRNGAAWSSGIVPSAAGPTLSSRLPPLATTSVSSATISRPVMWCSARSARLWQKL